MSNCMYIIQWSSIQADIVEVGLRNTCTIVALSPDRNCLEVVTDWPNMDVAVIMTSYGCCLFGGRPVKTAV